MTTKPEIKSDLPVTKGLAALGLFVVMAAVVVAAQFGPAEGFPEGANITASIGYAMFDIGIDRISGQTLVGGEGFLVAFIVIAVVLDVALDGSLLLAKREREGESVTALLADGGRELRRTVLGADAPDAGASDGDAGEDPEAARDDPAGGDR